MRLNSKKCMNGIDPSKSMDSHPLFEDGLLNVVMSCRFQSIQRCCLFVVYRQKVEANVEQENILEEVVGIGVIVHISVVHPYER